VSGGPAREVGVDLDLGVRVAGQERVKPGDDAADPGVPRYEQGGHGQGLGGPRAAEGSIEVPLGERPALRQGVQNVDLQVCASVKGLEKSS
jgi:hypothetical protein